MTFHLDRYAAHDGDAADGVTSIEIDQLRHGNPCSTSARVRRPPNPCTRDRVPGIMDAIATQLHDGDGQLREHVRAHHADLAKLLLTSVKGVGPTTASTLPAQLPKLGRLNVSGLPSHS